MYENVVVAATDTLVLVLMMHTNLNSSSICEWAVWYEEWKYADIKIICLCYGKLQTMLQIYTPEIITIVNFFLKIPESEDMSIHLKWLPKQLWVFLLHKLFQTCTTPSIFKSENFWQFNSCGLLSYNNCCRYNSKNDSRHGSIWKLFHNTFYSFHESTIYHLKITKSKSLIHSI